MIRHKPVHKRKIDTGEQLIYRFANDFGASVICGPYSYGGDEGLWELAVLKFNGPTWNDFDLTYDTPITSDVEGHLGVLAVDALLDRIEKLPT